MKKGVFDEPYWTAIVAIVATVSIIVIVFFMIYSTLRTSDIPVLGGHNNAFRQTMKFVDVVQDPFIISSVVSDLRKEDRDVYEHATQIMTTARIDQPNGNYGADNHGTEEEDFSDGLEEFLNAYDIKYYSVLIEKNDVAVTGFNNLPNRCGDHNQGFCTEFGPTTAGNPDVGKCDVGRIEINDAGKCDDNRNEVCCQAVEEDVYKQRADAEGYDTFDVVPCGRPQIGICSVGSPQYSEREVCNPLGEGRKKVNDFGDCDDVNDGDTPNCCITLAPETLQSLEYTVAAEIPLIYKDNFGTLEVGVGE